MTMPIKAGAILTIDELARLRGSQLLAVFKEGLLPDRLSALNGRPRGRLLAVSYLDRGPLRALASLVAGSRFFPWDGKSFSSTGKKTGAGRNRLHVLNRHYEWFSFKTRVEKSLLDGKPCVRLDYGLGENPWPINKLRDELREVSPGLFMGPSMLVTGSSQEQRILLWYAVDARVQG